MQLGTKRNYKVVEEKLLGFVLVYKLACTELHGSYSFVKCVSRFCVKIHDFDFRQHSTVHRKAYYHAIQNVFVVLFKFLITDSTKKSRGRDSFRVCFVNMTSLVLCRDVKFQGEAGWRFSRALKT